MNQTILYHLPKHWFPIREHDLAQDRLCKSNDKKSQKSSVTAINRVQDSIKLWHIKEVLSLIIFNQLVFITNELSSAINNKKGYIRISKSTIKCNNTAPTALTETGNDYELLSVHP